MNAPYTDSPYDVFLTAESAVGVLLTSVLWDRPIRGQRAGVADAHGSNLVTLPILVGIWLCALSTSLPRLFDRIASITLPPTALVTILTMGTALGTLTLVLAQRWRLALVALAGQYALWRASHYLLDSDSELAALHLALIGVMIGGARFSRTGPPAASITKRRLLEDDLILGGIVFALATFVAVVVLERGCESDDEWAYTWQAALFAHGRAFLPMPPCGESLRNYWIFFYQGREFAQYTPGWPLFMAPFAAIHVPWLAGPVSHGLLAVGVARVTRRVVAPSAKEQTVANPRSLRAAGLIGGLAATTSATALLNGGSRYSHVFVAMLFAWSVELAASLVFDEMEADRRLGTAALLGVGASGLLSTRPGDGATLGIGIFVIFAYGILGKRIRLTAILATTVGFVVVGGLTLVILRLQLGTWFKTGYSLAGSYYPWAEPKFSVPQPNQFKYGIPVGVTAYSLWPATAPVGIAGLVAARGRGRIVAVAVGVGTLALVAFYTMSEFGRFSDFGYGNRFHLPCVVALGAGVGLLLAPLFATSTEHGSAAFGLSAPAAVSAFATLSATLQIAALMYPPAHTGLRAYTTLERAIKKADIHNAVLTVTHADTGLSDADVTRNWPIPQPDVIIGGASAPRDIACLREHFPDRKFYRAEGHGELVHVVPY